MAERILRGPEQFILNYSFGKLLHQKLLNGGSRIAMVDASTGETATYKEILHRSVSLALYLESIGITKNDVISISSENSLHFTIPSITGLFMGVTLAPLNHFYTIREFVYSMKLSQPKVVFCSSNILNNIIQASREVKCVSKIIVLNACDNPPRSVLQMKDLINTPYPDNYETTPVEMDLTAAILCSSGTTGLPKGVMLTHYNFQSILDYLKRPDFGNYNSTRVGLALLPFYHAYGFLSHLCMLATNMEMVVMPRFEEKMFLNAIERYRISYGVLVPPLILFLAKSPLVDNYDLSSLEEIICGAAPLGKEVQDLVVERLKVIVRQGYGLTEITLAATLQPNHIQRSGSIGLLVPGMECKVIDIETGQTLGPCEQGELCFRGPQIMKGYVGDQKATDDTIDKDGWLHSGDLGYYDRDAFFYISDRLKELIKYKGFQVPPAELEAIMLNHPQILDCAVIGKPDEKAGELPIAFVVKVPKATIKESDVLKYVSDNVSYHKRLHGGVQFVDSIPKNPTGKILRRVLREQLKASLSKL